MPGLKSFVRRNYVNVIGLDTDALLNLGYRNGSGALQQLCQLTGMIGREVQNDDVSHAALSRHVREELLERLDAARRGADADDQKSFFAVRVCGAGGD